MKFSFLLFFISISSLTVAQELDLKRIETKFNLQKTTNFTRLNSNHNEFSQIFFALHFADSTTKIYDRREDTISVKSYTHFRVNPKCCGLSFIGLTNDFWDLMKEDYMTQNGTFKSCITTIGSFDSRKIDSVIQLSYNDHFGEFINDTLRIFKYDSTVTQLATIDNVKEYIESFNNGVFVYQFDTLSNRDIVVYLDYLTGLNKFNFEVDSIFNVPNFFSDYSLIKKNGLNYIYSFHSNKIIESDFNLQQIIPIYDVPLIVKKNYIAYGGSDWHKFRIRKADKVEFQISGDRVIAIISNSMGDEIKINISSNSIIN
jgi:hypothetical protein